MVISSNGIIVAHDNCRVNSSERQKENNKYFKAFVSDALNELEKGHSVLILSKDQLNEVKKVMQINYKYNEKYKWWMVSKK